MQINNKVFVVTGGGSGIGREMVLNLLKKGAKVAMVDIHEDAMKETRDLSGDLGKRTSLHVANIADKVAVEALPDQVIAKHGQVDVVINNAGIIQPFVRVNDLSYNDIDRVMQVNFYGTLYMTKTFLPLLLKRPEAHIVNVASMGGFLPVPGQSIYGAAKAAVKLMTEALQGELADTSVNVTLAFPGAIATNIMDNSGLKMDRAEQTDNDTSKMKPMPADEAADEIIKAMEKNKVRLCVGKDSKTMHRLYRLSPKFATNLIAKNMKSLLT
jgi:short-subunit dehydrogenase